MASSSSHPTGSASARIAPTCRQSSSGLTPTHFVAAPRGSRSTSTVGRPSIAEQAASDTAVVVLVAPPVSL